MAGDSADPFLARVVDFAAGNSGRSIVHLEVLGVPDQVIDELRPANHILNPEGPWALMLSKLGAELVPFA